MTASDKLKEFAKKWGRRTDLFDNDVHVPDECLSDLTALISEYYVPKEDYDKLGRLMEQLADSDDDEKYFDLSGMDMIF